MWLSQCFLTMDGENTRASASRAGIYSEETGRHFSGQPCDGTGHHEDEGEAVCACRVTSVMADSVPPTDCSPPGPSVPGILRARTLEWVAMPSSRGPSRPRDRTWVSHLSRPPNWDLCAVPSLGSCPRRPQVIATTNVRKVSPSPGCGDSCSWCFG